MIDIDKIYNEDCLEGMKRIDDGSVDCIITDLPYGTTACAWDSVIPFEPLWEQFKRVTKPNAAIVLFSSGMFTAELMQSNKTMFRQKLTWLKTRPTNVFNAKKQFMNWTEDICVFYDKLPTFNPQFWDDGTPVKQKVQHLNTDRSKGTLGQTGEREGFISVWGGNHRYPKSVLEFSNVLHGEDLKHPTQKPVDLLRYLILTYTNSGGSFGCLHGLGHNGCGGTDGKAPLYRLRDQQRILRHRTAAHRRRAAKSDPVLAKHIFDRGETRASLRSNISLTETPIFAKV